MSKLVCHISPEGGVDEKIGDYIFDATGEDLDRFYIGSLRALYDEYNEKPLIEDGIKDSELDEATIAFYAKQLQIFKSNLSQRHLNEMKETTKHTAKTFAQLYKVDGWNAERRRDRINNVANMFSIEVSDIQAKARKKGINLSRQDIINGYKANGKYQYGQAYVFERVFDRIFNKYVSSQDTVETYKKNTIEDTETSAKDQELGKQYLQFYQHCVDEYGKMMQNWSALCTFARIKLRDREGLKLGATLEYAAPTTPDNFIIASDNDELYNEEEAIREAWQVMQEEISAFGSLGKETRNFLSSIVQVDAKGEPVTDDLECKKYLDPVYMHQKLADELRGQTTESGMIRKLYEMSKGNPQYKEIFHALALYSGVKLKDTEGNLKPISDTNKPKNGTLITQFLVDMHKNFVPYSGIIKLKGKLFAKILNRQENALMGDYLLRIESGQILPGEENNSIYNSDATINTQHYINFMEEANRLIPYEGKLVDEKKHKEIENENRTTVFLGAKVYGKEQKGFWSKDFTRNDRIQYIIRASRALGLNVDIFTAMSIYDGDPVKRKEYLRALREFSDETFRSVFHANSQADARDRIFAYMRKQEHTAEEEEQYKKDYAALDDKIKDYSYQNAKGYRGLLESKYGTNQEDRKGNGIDRIEKMADIIAAITTNYNTERRVSWFDRKGKTTSRYSDRTPCYMGDMVDKIRAFAKEGDAEGLRSYIMDKWGNSSFFYDKENHKWRNHWLGELYDSIRKNADGTVTIKQDSLAKLFEYNEFLGSNYDGSHNIFENFTTKQHAGAMILQFLQEDGAYSNSKRKVSRYPSFILGDSGKQMFFVSRHYSVEDVVDFISGDVIKQEFERIKYVKAMNEVMLKFFADNYGFSYKDENGKELRDDNGDLILKDKEGNIIPEEDYKKLGYRPVDNFSQTADEFTMLPFLNKDFKNGKYWRMLTGKTVEELSDEQLKAISKKEAAQMVVRSNSREEVTRQYLADSFEKFLNTLEGLGIIAKNTNPKTGEAKKDEVIERKFKDKRFKDVYSFDEYIDKSGYFEGKLKSYDGSITFMLMDFFFNTKFATIEQLQMFTVDPAFYDHRYPIKDLQKRYKEIYAPGKGISTEARDYKGNLYITKPYENAAYFDDISTDARDVNPMFMEMIEQQFGKDSFIYNLYTKNTMTDGQGYRTLDSYRAVKGAAGEWTLPMENAYQQIKQIRAKDRLTPTDIKELTSLAVFFQPIKPYMYTLENVQINDSGDTALIPVQHKYAEIVLIPELMQDGKLRDLALWMENHQDEEGNADPIDLVCSTKAVKVGSFGSAILEGKNTHDEVFDAMSKAYVHKLSWADYRVQSGVPQHVNHAQLVGTQMRKLFYSCIKMGGNYSHYLTKIFGDKVDSENPTIYIPGKGEVHLTGRNLVSLYNCLIMSGMFDDYDQLADELKDNKSLSDKMIQNVISNANQNEDRMYALSLIDDEDSDAYGQIMVPLGEPMLEHDTSALLFSMFRKGVGQQRIKGGACVQASAMGISGRKAADAGNLYEIVDKEEDDTYNVLYDEIEMPFNLTYTNSFGANTPLNFNDWCNTDGTLKMSKEIVYREDGDGRYREFMSWPVSGRDEHGRVIDESKGYYVPLIEKSYPGILNIIAYRIPTERNYSELNCKVVRFTQSVEGGVMKVPASRTTTAGFDFDIDKLYFYMKEYKQKKMSKDKIAEIWESIYSDNPQIKQALLNTFTSSSSDLSYELGKLIMSDDVDNPYGRLYKHWEEAGLTGVYGTASEYFTKYLEKHRDKYPIDEIFETYDPTVSPLENSRAARNNLFMDLVRARLQSPETLKARYTPGGFRGNSDAALKMRILRYAAPKDIMSNGRIDFKKVQAYADRINNKEILDPEPLYDVSDPTTILVYNQQNQVAGKLIGIFANENTNHVFSSVLHKLRLNDAVQFGDLVKHTEGLSDLLHAPEGIDVDTNVAEYLAASVDAVKDPVLNYLNLNSITADAGALLARLGYTPVEIGLLFNQPIIKELCDEVQNNNSFIDYAFNTVLSKISKERLDDIKLSPEGYLTSEKLAKNIVDSRDSNMGIEKASAELKASQVQVLKLFKNILKATKDLNSFVQASRFTASNSVGSTWGDYYNQKNRVDSFEETFSNSKSALDIELFNPSEQNSFVQDVSNKRIGYNNKSIILNSEALLEVSPEKYLEYMSSNPFGFEQCAYDMKRKAVKNLFSQHFPYETELYKNVRTKLLGLTKNKFLSADEINSTHREFAVYALTKQAGSEFDGEATYGDTEITNREFYNKVFPIVIQVLKNMVQKRSFTDYTGEYADLVNFLNALNLRINETSTSEDYRNSIPLLINKQGMGSLQGQAASDFTAIWAGLANSKSSIYVKELNSEIPLSEIAKGFYFYNYYLMGYNYSGTTTMTLAPTVLLENLRVSTNTGEMSYLDFWDKAIKGEIKMTSNDITMFAKQYMMNHTEDKNLVYEVKGNALKEVNKEALNEEGELKGQFTLSQNKLGNYANQFIISSDKTTGNTYFRPVLAIRDRRGNVYYYIAKNGNDFNASKNGTMTYTRINPQGKKGLMVRYFGDRTYEKFNDNKGKLESNTNVKLADFRSKEETNAEEDSPITNTGETQGTGDSNDSPLDYFNTVDDVYSNANKALLDKLYNVMIKESGGQIAQDTWKNSIELPDGTITFKSPGEYFNILKMTGAEDQNILSTMNDLYRKLDKGELKTLDTNGKDIEVCG